MFHSWIDLLGKRRAEYGILNSNDHPNSVFETALFQTAFHDSSIPSDDSKPSISTPAAVTINAKALTLFA